MVRIIIVPPKRPLRIVSLLLDLQALVAILVTYEVCDVASRSLFQSTIGQNAVFGNPTKLVVNFFINGNCYRQVDWNYYAFALVAAFLFGSYLQYNLWLPRIEVGGKKLSLLSIRPLALSLLVIQCMCFLVVFFCLIYPPPVLLTRVYY